MQNARAWQQLRRDVGGDEFILPFFYACVGGRPLYARRSPHNPVPAATPAGEALSKELKRRGFTMTGPITCHNIMQTAGLVNDHLLGCPRHAECHRLARD